MVHNLISVTSDQEIPHYEDKECNCEASLWDCVAPFVISRCEARMI